MPLPLQAPKRQSRSEQERVYQGEGGILDEARGGIETVSGTGDGVSVLVLLIISVFYAACAALISGGVIAYLRSNTMAVRTIAGAAFATGVATALLGSLGQAEVFDDLRWPMLFIPLGVLAMVFWVTMLIDCAVEEPSKGNDKVVWTIIIVFTQLIGAAIYLLVRRPKRMAESRR